MSVAAKAFTVSLLLAAGPMPARDANTVRDGFYQRHYANGRVAEQGWYRAGVKDSLWVEWDTNGAKVLEEEWREGVRHGKHWGVDPDSGYWSEGEYVRGLKEGRWIETLRITGIPAWDSYQTLCRGCIRDGRQRGDYVGGRREGRWVEEPETDRGTKAVAQGSYVRGRRQGRWLYWLADYKGRHVRCSAWTYGESQSLEETACPDSVSHTWPLLGP